MWVLRAANRPHTDPWEWMSKVAERRDTTATALYGDEKLTEEELGQKPLDQRPLWGIFITQNVAQHRA